jgi:hypothetical protein
VSSFGNYTKFNRVTRRSGQVRSSRATKCASRQRDGNAVTTARNGIHTEFGGGEANWINKLAEEPTN